MSASPVIPFVHTLTRPPAGTVTGDVITTASVRVTASVPVAAVARFELASSTYVSNCQPGLFVKAHNNPPFGLRLGPLRPSLRAGPGVALSAARSAASKPAAREETQPPAQ